MTKNENLKSKLAINRKNAWEAISSSEIKVLELLSKEYLDFLNTGKTERLVHDYVIKIALKNGYKNIEEYIKKQGSLIPGDKIFRTHSGRTIFLAKLGKKPLTEGMRIIGAHIDAPRLDTKPNPLYEDSELVLMDTHYYGGIKKYQWVTIPLAMYGIIIKKDGKKVKISIGDGKSDPVFTITDLLPHLAKEQAKKSLSVGINGEGLNVLVGSRPLQKSELKDCIKENILGILNKKYQIKEEDFYSADLEFVPAGEARELGFDRSMILGYGQDDRICAFSGLKSFLDVTEIPEFTTILLLCDKEEIGSSGATGMDSFFFENSVAELGYSFDGKFNDLKLKRAMENSKMISADVTAVHDPNYPDVSAPNNNMAWLNYGPIFSKYTGSRGKYGASEASAEFMGEMRQIFDNADICWQSSEMGKVDAGGGGTIAHFFARYGMDVLDCGPGLLSMHSPWEVSSKIDLYYTWKGYKAFYINNHGN